MLCTASQKYAQRYVRVCPLVHRYEALPEVTHQQATMVAYAKMAVSPSGRVACCPVWWTGLRRRGLTPPMASGPYDEGFRLTSYAQLANAISGLA